MLLSYIRILYEYNRFAAACAHAFLLFVLSVCDVCGCVHVYSSVLYCVPFEGDHIEREKERERERGNFGIAVHWF